MPQTELNVSWNLDVSIINMDRKSTRRIPLVLTQGRGKRSPNTQNVAIPHPSLFSLFPPLSSFSCTPGLKQSWAVASAGQAGAWISEGYEPSSQIGGAVVSREWGKSHCFSFPSALLLLGPDVGMVMGSIWKNGANEAPAFCRKAEKGKPQESRGLQVNEKLGKVTT